MQQFTHTIRDELGLHARPAALLVRLSTQYKSRITLTKGEKVADAKGIFAVMTLGVKCGDTLTVTVEGEDELEAAEALREFFQRQL
ncbi:HPr family phosphocarrier protein [Symbiobacterium thermophilum]|uniref:Phosphocarrier protein HPr n=1 Tax=Symbiobacterium thermophilum (strain DSM 24528 / JCM 14929 / IAM 14863 / T) TaxID=292459 RepID=Q67QV3_SYMTH|nr:HPr family phosphocarrier protein [Symbiobacterium thermophilum]BAD39940.1 PTS system phosphocarrier protein Hpr [Symbiobacterium thermophilum IAM 14863]